MDDEEEMLMDPPDPDTTCNICNAEFLDPEDLAVHLTQVHVDEDLIHPYVTLCQFCSAVFTNAGDYVTHLTDTHLASVRRCKFCTRAFTDYKQLQRHESKHPIYKKNMLFSCSQCNKVFNEISELEQHEFTKHGEIKEGVFLNRYYSLLSSVLNIKAVKFLHSLGTDTSYFCTKCGYNSNDVINYIKHLQIKNCVSLVCNTCSNVYKDKSSLWRHLQDHKECWIDATDQDMEKKCQACHKMVKVANLKSHRKECKVIKCSICKVILSSMYELSEHQTKAHPMAIMMKFCMLCNREFVGTVALEKHINRSHKKHFHLYKYKCMQCDKYFKHPKELFAHYFSTHRDLHPYSCKMCDKRFRIRKAFTLHIKMEHKSEGYVEFDENYHVFFAAEKSANPFQPTSFFQNDNETNENVTETEVEQTDAEVMQVPETTDAETDIEKIKTDNRKHPKMRFKQPRKDVSLQSDFLNSEAENRTENETNRKANNMKLIEKRITRKRNRKIIQKSLKKRRTTFSENFSEDEPLSKLRHVSRKSKSYNRNVSLKNRKLTGRNKKRFTCEICNEYCYTFQNYNHHISTHSNREEKKCIKCSKRFKSNDDLTKHMKKKHSTSKLTETLKNLLERRKLGKNNPVPQLTMQERFKRTIKMVKEQPVTEVAKLTEVPDKLSVQKFIESFTPEENTKKPEVLISTSVTITPINQTIYKQPLIKMKKFTPLQEKNTKQVKLSMPVRYKQTNTEQYNVSVRLIQKPFPSINASVTQSEELSVRDYESHNEFIDYEEEIDSHDKNVPDVAQEIMLEEEKPRVIPHKLVIPKLEKTELKEMRIAHLLPEAPYFKIVKMKEVLAQKAKEKEVLPDPKEELPKLPDGTKLVNVNPLAHLIGNKSIESIVGPANKYRPKSRDSFERAIAQALLKLDSPLPMRTVKRRGKRDLTSTVET
ncbi:zinc finger protein 43-like [Hyposmocoma kahamanoa]|uniref:zinc finger protein 43-like n=1 Tax=Hyposmocoma kahamanoa TaxID=1477025 RepID=UPI000E6DA46A|nr:zinc finger protein 43-like [Hyposmocoma kahamanoa]